MFYGLFIILLLYFFYKFLENYLKTNKFLCLCAFNKTPFGKTICLSNHYLISGCSSIQFFNSFFVIYHVMPLVTTLITHKLCDLRTPCHDIDHHSHFPPNPYLKKQKISLGIASILRMCLCPYA